MFVLGYVRSRSLSHSRFLFLFASLVHHQFEARRNSNTEDEEVIEHIRQFTNLRAHAHQLHVFDDR